MLVRHYARPPAAQHRRQLNAQVPRHARGNAPDARTGGRSAAVAVPAAGLRDDLELTATSAVGHLSKSLFARWGPSAGGESWRVLPQTDAAQVTGACCPS